MVCTIECQALPDCLNPLNGTFWSEVYKPSAFLLILLLNLISSNTNEQFSTEPQWLTVVTSVQVCSSTSSPIFRHVSIKSWRTPVTCPLPIQQFYIQPSYYSEISVTILLHLVTLWTNYLVILKYKSSSCPAFLMTFPVWQSDPTRILEC